MCACVCVMCLFIATPRIFLTSVGAQKKERGITKKPEDVVVRRSMEALCSNKIRDSF